MYTYAHEWGQDPAVLKTVAELRSYVSHARLGDRTVALVPTMGALHDGHIELVRQGQKLADSVIVSIFVNPAQFGPNEDFSAYPRTWDADLEKLTAANANAIFLPQVAEMYPPGFSTYVSLTGVSEPLEGERRPGHFAGVATVVAKLLLQCGPHMALFGEKDWQQLQVIRRMTADLDIPVKIVGVPTVRDKNGLALSSRNAYLTEDQYNIAIRLNKILFAMADQLRQGSPPAGVQKTGMDHLLQAGFDSIDYLEIRDAATLGVPGSAPLRILAAVKCGKARLIDNVPV